MSFQMRILVLGLCLFLFTKSYAQEVNRTFFFAALSTGDTLKINEQLKKIKASSSSDKQAYTGVLLMRKAELVKGLKRKLDLFKAGGKKLEDAIALHKTNTEYRFLRLLIQENAPMILNYNNNINEDAAMVKSGYSKLSQETQKAVLDYCKKSKVLKTDDFKSVKHE